MRALVPTLCVLAGCFYPEKHLDLGPDGRTSDGSPPVRDMSGPQTDGGDGGGRDTGIDGHLDSSSAACAFPSEVFFTGSDEQAGSQVEGAGDVVFWQSDLQGGSQELLGIEVVAGQGSQSPDWPTGDVTPKDNVVLANSLDAIVYLSAGSADAMGVPQVLYLSITGTLTIREISPAFSGSTSAITFQHYDESDTGTLTPDPDGCESTISGFTFEAAVPID